MTKFESSPSELVDEPPVWHGLRGPVHGHPRGEELVRVRPHQRGGLPDVADELLLDAVLGVEQRAAEVDASGELESVLHRDKSYVIIFFHTRLSANLNSLLILFLRKNAILF